MIKFFVPGKPQQQGSKVKNRWGGMREDNKELGPWRERVALAADRALCATTNGHRLLADGPLAMDLEFILYRPKSLPKTKPTPQAVKKPDIDKLARGVLDALTGVIYHDDLQVVDLALHKRVAELGEPMGVHVLVRTFP